MTGTAGPGPRSRARALALQALYQWQMTGQDLSEIERQFFEDNDPSGFDTRLFRDLLHGVPSHLSELDQALGPWINRPLERSGPVERALLRLGAYEFLYHPEVPVPVIVNEAVELVKTFGPPEARRYVNGVLDRLGRHLRPGERRKGRG